MNQFLLFKVGTYMLGINTNNLVEILSDISIDNNHINLRNQSIQVIDTHDFFEYQSVSDSTKLLVINVNHSIYSLIIDDVFDIISVEDINIFNTPTMINNFNKYVKYVIKSNNSLYPILDIESLI